MQETSPTTRSFRNHLVPFRRNLAHLLMGLALVNLSACAEDDPAISAFEVATADILADTVTSQDLPPSDAPSGEVGDTAGLVACQSDADCAAPLDAPRCQIAVCGENGYCELVANPDVAILPEVCNGQDDDCDGLVDAEDDSLALVPCEMQQGVCAGLQKPAALCLDGAWRPCDETHTATITTFEATEATCDGLDNDCDGLVDAADSDVTAACCQSGEDCPTAGEVCVEFTCQPGEGLCDADEDCEQTQYCDLATGMCVGFAVEGDACTDDAECAAGLECGPTDTCVPKLWCGDGTCSDTENCLTCAKDCGCEDGSVCHDGSCCAPQCDGRECGPDSCGGTCSPGCNAGELCTVDGQCTPLTHCGDGTCDGADNESCTTCPSDCACDDGTVCTDGSCCTPSCDGKTCGPDGCGGTCAPGCQEGEVCDGTGTCAVLTTCGDGVCDPAAEETCLTCLKDCACEAPGLCFNGACCAPQCDGKDCGPDSCGGQCQPGCGDGEYCGPGGICAAISACGDGTCDPAAEETCATCKKDCACTEAVCFNNACCEPQCDGKTCGPDGCGGTCGAGCLEGQYCTTAGECQALTSCGDGTCDPAAEESCFTCIKDCGCAQGTTCHQGVCCTPQCDGRDCGPDLCGGECGQCGEGEYCGTGGQCTAVTSCGDGTCDPAAEETCLTCKKDCGCVDTDVCADGLCCSPSCDGKSCGPDGCGGTCGACATGTTCDSAGKCAPLSTCGSGGCQPELGENCISCAPDCGCEDSETCTGAGLCCAPNCEDRECGQDGCGGSCGDCGEGTTCSSQGQCVPLSTCGVGGCQPGLGESCLTCPTDCGCDAGASCVGGTCLTADCEGRECGPDGVGGSCGQCQGSEFCSTAGQCVCLGTVCGETCCLPGQACGAGDTCCTPDCAGKTCGDNGCGGTCGTCPLGFSCNSDGQCGPESGCGNGTCDEGEGCLTCAVDCACGTGELCLSGGVGGVGQCQCLGPQCDGSCCLPTEVCTGTGCCKPSCEGKQCGSDGCGGVCGQCFGTEICKQFSGGSFACCDDACPTGWECGVNECGRNCGTCSDGEACNFTTHQCETIETCGTVGHEACEPEAPWFENCSNCSDCACEDTELCDPAQDPGGSGCVACDPEHDGVLCGGECCEGKLSDGVSCNGGACCQSDCVQYGGARECGTDACGGTCGTCSGVDGIQCIAGSCECPFEACQNDLGETACCDDPGEKCHQYGSHPFPVCYQPQCSAGGGPLECGDDPNGYSCGTCPSGGTCLRYSDANTWQACPQASGSGCDMAGAFKSECCVPDCSGKACGPDGCGGTCGSCGGGQVCNEEAGTCCLPVCNPADECGDDGCGGTCGAGCSGDTFCVLDPEAASYRVCKPKTCDDPLQCTLDGADGSCLACPDPLSVCTDNGVNDACESPFTGSAWPIWLRGTQNHGQPAAALPHAKWRLDGNLSGRAAVIDDQHLFTTDGRYVRIWHLGGGAPYADSNGNRRIRIHGSNESYYGALIVQHDGQSLYVATECDAVRAWLICSDGTDKWLGSGTTCPATAPGSVDYPTPLWETPFTASGTCYNRATVGYTHDEDGSNYQRAIFHVAGDHKLYALNAGTGQTIWSVTMGGTGSVYSSPAVTPDGNVVAASITGVLYSIRPDGKARWSAKVGDSVRSDPLVYVTQATDPVRYQIFVAPTGSPSYQARVLSYGQDGSRLWTSQFAQGQTSSVSALRLTEDGRVAHMNGSYYSSEGFSNLTFLDPATGNVLSAEHGPHGGGQTALFASNTVGSWLARCNSCRYGALVFYGDDNEYIRDIVPTYDSSIGGITSLSRSEELLYSPLHPNVMHVANQETTWRLVPMSCSDLGYTECGTDALGQSCGTCAVGDCYEGRCVEPVVDGAAGCGYDGAGGSLGAGCSDPRETCGATRQCEDRVDGGAVYAMHGGDTGHTWNIPTLTAPAGSIPGTWEEFTFHGEGRLSTGIAQDEFGHVVVGATNNWLYKLVTTGTGGLEWEWIYKEAAGYFLGQPYIADDGTVFCGNQDRNVYAMGLNVDDQIVTRWKFGVPDLVQGSTVPASLVDPADPTQTPVPGLLVVAGSTLYALDAYTSNPAGHLLWQLDPLEVVPAVLTSSRGGTGSTISTPTVGPDGTIYVQAAEWVIAFNPDGRIKWKFAVSGTVRNAPIVDAANNRLFVVPRGRLRTGTAPNYNDDDDRQSEQAVTAVDLNKSPGDPDFVLWRYKHNPTAYPSTYIDEGALSPDGSSVYILTDIRTSGTQLHVVKVSAATGTEQWRVPVPLSYSRFGASGRHMYVIGNGSVLVGGMSFYEYDQPSMVSISASGTLQFNRNYCSSSNCTTQAGEWVPGRTGTLLFPASSQAISGSYGIRRQ